ncbi:hypothetical protein [Asticcacaulis solisilvae]|uniref:hypothetical protein n=1 Tax=Asticcacaulis solisilvae TaxID=1217274 RepID=UPI003FD72533
MPEKQKLTGGQVAARIALAIVGAGAAAVARSCTQDMFDANNADKMAEQVDAELTSDPSFSKSFVLLKDHFPNDYAALKSGVVDLAKSGKGKDAVANFSFYTMRRFMIAHTADFMAAGSPALSSFRKAQIDWFEALLQQSPDYCAYIIKPQGPREMPFSDATKRVGDTMLAAQLSAMVDGQTAKISRKAPTQAIYRNLGKAMVRQGMTPADLDAASDMKKLDSLPDAPKCRIVIMELKAIDALPAAEADSVTVAAFKDDSDAAAAALNSAPPQ